MRLRRWVLIVTLGETLGLSVPAGVGVAVTAVSWRRLATFVAIVLPGSVEGALLGLAQADCLYRWAVSPVRRSWVLATSLGATLAWSLGTLPSLLGGLKWTAGSLIAAATGALILLASLPLAQYVVLRDHVSRAIWWIPINMAAWLAGIAWTLVPSPWVDQSTPIGSLIVMYGVAGLCMAATVAVITGLGMIRLLPRPGAIRSTVFFDQERIREGAPSDQIQKNRKESEWS